MTRNLGQLSSQQQFGMGFSWRIASIFISHYFNPLSRVALHPSSCTHTLNHHLHLSFTCTGDKCVKPVIKRKGWQSIIVQVYTPGVDLSVIPLRTSSIRSSSMTTVEKGHSLVELLNCMHKGKKSSIYLIMSAGKCAIKSCIFMYCMYTKITFILVEK